MREISKAANQVTIGVDLGDRWSRYCVLDESGEVTQEGRIATTPAAMEAHFAGKATARVVIEVGGHSPWVQRLLATLGHETITAHAQAVRLIHGGTNKNDRLDAERLARLGRLDPKLLHPVEHRSDVAQADAALIQSRDALVRCRSALINHARGLVKSVGGRLAKCSSSVFAARAADDLPKPLKHAMLPILQSIESLTRKVRLYDKRIETLSQKRYPHTALLKQVSGVGSLTALAFVLKLENPARFKSSRSVGAFLGLQPRQRQSSEQDPELRITKAGDQRLRRLLVGSAQYILGPFGPDTDLRRWGLALAARGRKNAKKRAVVAVARKLAVLLHRLWVTAESYEPLRQATA
jgi:transposase